MFKRTGFVRKLNNWYRKNARKLPWRTTRDPYKIWISEVMLQQTTVTTVIPYYSKWIKKYPTARHVAKTSLQNILKIWQGLGYYTRARNIHKAARVIVKNHKDKIPSDYESLKQLPGFGPYTIGAVLSIAFNKRYPIVDANIRRVLMRLLAIQKEARPARDPILYRFLNDVLPHKNLRIFNQALMELGALICRSKEPLCSMCPVKDHCKAFGLGIQELIPRTTQKQLQELNVVVGIIERRGAFFMQKRPSNGLLGDLWEFPGGKINKGETKENALKRELKEELNIDITALKPLSRVRHFYTKYKVNLYPFSCTPKQSPSLNSRKRWIKVSEMMRFPMPSGTAKIIENL